MNGLTSKPHIKLLWIRLELYVGHATWCSEGWKEWEYPKERTSITDSWGIIVWGDQTVSI